jgi:hypothetical protein
MHDGGGRLSKSIWVHEPIPRRSGSSGALFWSKPICMPNRQHPVTAPLQLSAFVPKDTCGPPSLKPQMSNLFAVLRRFPPIALFCGRGGTFRSPLEEM